MARILVDGDVNRRHFAPPGWMGCCPMCGAVVVTESRDFNLGDGTVFLIACPTPRCEGRIQVLPHEIHNSGHASSVEYLRRVEGK